MPQVARRNAPRAWGCIFSRAQDQTSSWEHQATALVKGTNLRAVVRSPEHCVREFPRSMVRQSIVRASSRSMVRQNTVRASSHAAWFAKALCARVPAQHGASMFQKHLCARVLAQACFKNVCAREFSRKHVSKTSVRASSRASMFQRRLYRKGG